METRNTPPSTSIAMMRANSLASLAQSEMEALILSGALKPGDRLGEAEMAERLGVSRGPVREAFRALEEQGLVRIEKNRGVFVRQVTIAEADETYAVRAVLEGLAGQTLALRASQHEHGTLQTFLASMKEAASKRSMKEYADLNVRFHQFIVDASGNGKLKEIYDGIIMTLTMYRNTTLVRGNSLEVSLMEHSRIVNAICSGDPVEARQAMIDHVESSQRRMHATQDD
ncbi:FCD domain-containing protein [Chelatococcus asaccharovorans]|uniref:GntR family transcriptional regulator n=1 Tax=Chelatococcus asaccharovorans TaxID=28210 RepID=A0A2V3UL60_9HYPH|nr:FCD domain-containing protein [Chelatococcus asaccharovorans]MBS7706306.1 FCD domain-containing protein [Chelatococcus asaccharovorans]PXW65054.1 GntR family transcriptional regulator [Chelatococcus asaccharovorans]CAH1660955.1 GntR family transcriptional regulator [Chelatococcus asaccharovorans]CAH1683615.1 GntR family transcriptional regulator [Chelatococcus asaccharovorans]